KDLERPRPLVAASLRWPGALPRQPEVETEPHQHQHAHANQKRAQGAAAGGRRPRNLPAPVAPRATAADGHTLSALATQLRHGDGYVSGAVGLAGAHGPPFRTDWRQLNVFAETVHAENAAPGAPWGVHLVRRLPTNF